MAWVRSAITGRAPCSATARAMAASSAGLTCNPGSVWNRVGLINTAAPGRRPASGSSISSSSLCNTPGTAASSATGASATEGRASSAIGVLHGDDPRGSRLGAGRLHGQREQLHDRPGETVYVVDVLQQRDARREQRVVHGGLGVAGPFGEAVQPEQAGTVLDGPVRGRRGQVRRAVPVIGPAPVVPQVVGADQQPVALPPHGT